MYPGLPTTGSWSRRHTAAATAAVRPSHVTSPTSASDKTALANAVALDAAIAGLASTSDVLIPHSAPADAGHAGTNLPMNEHSHYYHHDAAATRTPLAAKPPSRRGSLFQIQVTRTSLETSSSHAASRSMHSSVAGGIDGSLYVPAATTGLIRPRAGQLLHRKSPRRLIHPVPESEPNDVDSILATARAGVAPGRAADEAAAEDEDISVDPTKLDPYLQALAVVHSAWIFFRELVVHWTPGAVLLTLFTRAGRIRAKNRAFFDWSMPCFMQWTFFAAFLVPMVLYSSGLASSWNIKMEEHINFCLIWLFRNAVVATKHAYTSPIEQAQMDEELESLEQRKDRQVLTAWHNPPSSVVELQILLASVRQSIDLTSGHFLLAPDDDDDGHHPLARSRQCAAMPASPHPPLPPSPGLPGTPAPADPAAPALIYDLRVRYGAYLDKTTCSTAASEAGSLAPGACPLVSSATGSSPPSPQPPDAADPNGGHIDAAAPHVPPTSPSPTPTADGPPVINDLVHESHGGPTIRPLVFVAAGFIYAMLPLLVRYCYNLPVMGGTDWAAILYTVCSMWITFMTMSSNYGFIVICIVDFHRREYLFRRLNAILWDGFVRQSEPAAPSSPSPPPTPVASPTSASPTTAVAPDAPHAVLNEKNALVGDSAPAPPPASPANNPCGAKPGLIRLDMSQSRNLLMWWYTRLILQDYGRPFLIRLSWYCGYFILYALIVGASVVANALGAFTIGPVGIVMGVFNLLTLLCALVNVLYHGMLVNDMRAAHVYTLIKRSKKKEEIN
ncbi:hypothetical protein AMAG_02516 [Allomyces macrogynus ATCC 38327]|uniref:Uncharacterized protein n=1 Tax=Allomyces macrogynus (strain ATCC 38327) TaxID=578462 RepID=A0A0L0S2V6_ALLM3|nr:hypothetical protein AMAG_02516 [Allomyces macrogynus ATCC 38327]|eukprot:KNE56736.1 hypothetical protein AMAG_02516 [Allomyces macrogynus ATCC 38327]